jgi:general stress protein 26
MVRKSLRPIHRFIPLGPVAIYNFCLMKNVSGKMAGFCLVLMGAMISPAGLSQQLKTDSSRIKVMEAAREIMNASATCALVTLDENGKPRVRTMDPFPPEEDFTIWLATNPKSRKVDELKKNASVALHYTDKNENGYVTVYGTARLIHDQKEKDKRWKDEWKNFYGNRSTEYLLIRIIPERLEVINYKRGITGDPVTWQPAVVMFKQE